MLAKAPREHVRCIKSADGVKKYFLNVVNNLPVLVFSIRNVSEGVRQEAQVAKTCVFCLIYDGYGFIKYFSRIRTEHDPLTITDPTKIKKM